MIFSFEHMDQLMKAKRRKLQRDHVWGIDRYTASPAFGDLTVPVIFLWSNPEGQQSPATMTGALNHGTEIIVKRHRAIDGEPWYRVENGALGQSGWCSGKLLKKRGEKLFG